MIMITMVLTWPIKNIYKLTLGANYVTDTVPIFHQTKVIKNNYVQLKPQPETLHIYYLTAIIKACDR